MKNTIYDGKFYNDYFKNIDFLNEKQTINDATYVLPFPNEAHPNIFFTFKVIEKTKLEQIQN